MKTKSTRKRTSETTKHAKKTKNPWLKSIATRGLPACDAQAGVKVAYVGATGRSPLHKGMHPPSVSDFFDFAETGHGRPVSWIH